MAEKTAVLEFEQVRQDYAFEDARGIPMSVHDRYRSTLAEMRFKIRETRNGREGKRLGELLVEQGAIDQETLRSALAEQQQRGKGELLGEILTTLGLIKEEALLSALRMQEREN